MNGFTAREEPQFPCACGRALGTMLGSGRGPLRWSGRRVVWLKNVLCACRSFIVPVWHNGSFAAAPSLSERPILKINRARPGMSVIVISACIGILFLAGLLALAIARAAFGRAVIYGLSFTACAAILLSSCVAIAWP